MLSFQSSVSAKSIISMTQTKTFLPMSTSKKIRVVVKSQHILSASFFLEVFKNLLRIRKCRFYLPVLEFSFSVGQRNTHAQILFAQFIIQRFLNICCLIQDADSIS